MRDIRRVKVDEFSSKFKDSLSSQANLTESSYSYFLLGENSGVIRDDAAGTVEFINLTDEPLNDIEEMELLINICGKPGEFAEKVKVPGLKTIADYEEEARYINKLSMLIWVAQISLILIPVALIIWIIALL